MKTTTATVLVGLAFTLAACPPTNVTASGSPCYNVSPELGGKMPGPLKDPKAAFESGEHLCAWGFANRPGCVGYDSMDETDMELQATGRLAGHVVTRLQRAADSAGERWTADECARHVSASPEQPLTAYCSELEHKRRKLTDQIDNKASAFMVGIVPGRMWENGRGIIYKAMCVSRSNIERAIALPPTPR